MGIPKLWGRKPGGVERGFVYSHVLTTYYNWKNKVLLKDKLDDMDKLIAEHGEAIAEKLITNEKFAETLANYVTKAMMTGQDVDNANMVPNSAFIHTLAQKITENQTAISTLNSASYRVINKEDLIDPDLMEFADGNHYYVICGKIVFVAFPTILSHELTGITWVMNGLPIPAGQRWACVAMACTDVGSKTLILGVRPNGTLYLSGGEAGRSYFGALIYIKND